MSQTKISIEILSDKVIGEIKRIIEVYKSHNKFQNESSTIHYLIRTSYGQSFYFDDWVHIHFTSDGLRMKKSHCDEIVILSVKEIMKIYSPQKSLF